MEASASLAVMSRPSSLKLIKGQPEATNLISGWIARQRLPSTILITGAVGCGKTSIARIISRTVNEVAPGDIDSDCHEANLASERGIEEARSIMQVAKFMPKKNLRIIILDEVHGATPQAIQAMLKMLEEPPKNTSWILCTSDPSKLPPAVLSRSARIVLKPYDVEDIIEILTLIAKKNKLFKETPEKDRIKLFGGIAVNTGCVPRDSIELLDAASVLWASGNYNSYQGLLKASLANLDISGDAVAIKLLLCLYNKSSLSIGVKTLRQVTNARQTLDTMLHVNQAVIDSLSEPRRWYTLPQNAFFTQASKLDIRLSLVSALGLHYKLAQIKQKLFYGSDETNIVLGEIGYLLIKREAP